MVMGYRNMRGNDWRHFHSINVYALVVSNWMFKMWDSLYQLCGFSCILRPTTVSIFLWNSCILSVLYNLQNGKKQRKHKSIAFIVVDKFALSPMESRWEDLHILTMWKGAEREGINVYEVEICLVQVQIEYEVAFHLSQLNLHSLGFTVKGI